MSRLSPVTGEPMLEREFLGVEVDVCPSTGGIWLDKGELGRLLREGFDAVTHVDEEVKPSADPQPAKGSRRCPVCQEVLYKYRYLQSTEVMLDGCEVCGGVFIEDGELGAIAAFLKERDDNPATLKQKVASVMAEVHADQYKNAQYRSWFDGLISVLRFRRP